MEERYIMVFDFETTGLPKYSWTNYVPGHSNAADWPHSVQLSYILYDLKTNTAKISDEIVRLPENILVSPESEAIHHISAEKTRGKGRRVKNRKTGRYRLQYHLTIAQILTKFMTDFRKADVIVAHNIQFDRNMLLVEMDRLQSQYAKMDIMLKEIWTSKKMYCTAKNGAFVCKITAINRYGDEYYRMPKLAVLYKTLFDVTPNEAILHNALYDVVLCLRSFCQMRYQKDIYGCNQKITELLDQVNKS